MISRRKGQGFIRAVRASRLSSDQGLSLVVVLMTMALLLSLSSAGLMLSGLNLKASANLKTGTAALHVADAGIQHALASISPVGADFDSLLTGSVTGFPCVPSSPCDGSTKKPTLTGSLSGYDYKVEAINDTSVPNEFPLDDKNRIVTFVSEATGPDSSKRKIKAYISRESFPPGAIYVPGPPNDLEFRIEGTATVTGNDTNVDGTPGPLAAIPGIATNDAGTTAELLSPGTIQTPSNVTGSGGTPSVATTESTLDINALANGFLSKPHTVVAGGSLTSVSWGDWTSPRITRVTGDVRLSGTSSGAGVLIVDGDLELEGTFSFKGFIIVRAGGELEIELTGAASTIYGAILIAPGTNDMEPELEIDGAGAIKFSSQAIQRVHETWRGVLPSAKLIAWHEMMQ